VRADAGLFDIAMVNAEDGWAVGTTWARAIATPLLLHWNGATWTPFSTDGHDPLYDIHMTSADDGWITGQLLSGGFWLRYSRAEAVGTVLVPFAAKSSD
jgi:hypothetical protein